MVEAQRQNVAGPLVEDFLPDGAGLLVVTSKPMLKPGNMHLLALCGARSQIPRPYGNFRHFAMNLV